MVSPRGRKEPTVSHPGTEDAEEPAAVPHDRKLSQHSHPRSSDHRKGLTLESWPCPVLNPQAVTTSKITHALITSEPTSAQLVEQSALLAYFNRKHTEQGQDLPIMTAQT